MSKITVINIDLGIPTDKIIAKNADAINDDTKLLIRSAILERRQIEQDRALVAAKIQQKADAITTAVETAFQFILSESKVNRPVSTAKLLTLAGPHIPNMISLVNRLRNYLRQNGNEYRLVNFKIAGKPHYTIMPHNLDQDQDPSSIL